MPVLGITGSLCGGKSTILKLMKKKGAVVFNADEIIHGYYRNKTSLIYAKVSGLFPEAVRKGVISRKKIADVVFSDKKKLRALEKAVHPAIIKDMLSWIAKSKGGKKVYVAEVPLLFEKKLQRNFDKIIVAVARRDILIRRIIKKYSFSRSKAVKRLSLYLPVKYKMKRADFVIKNNYSLKELKKEVDLLWDKIKLR